MSKNVKDYLIIIVVAVVLSYITTYTSSNKHDNKPVSQSKQVATQTEVKKIDNKEIVLKRAEAFFDAFCKGDDVTASKLCYHEKRIVNNVSKEEVLNEFCKVFAGGAALYSKTTGINTTISSSVSDLHKIDENHYTLKWSFALGGDRASIPDITMVKVNGQWFVDFESFAIPFTQMFG